MFSEIEELDVKIRGLCGRLLTAEDGPEMGGIIYELCDTLHEHTEAVRKLASVSLKGTLGKDFS
jgi:hypothetical protein